MSQLYGLAFVEYEDEESAGRAIAGMNGKKLGNQTLKISYYQRQPKFQPPQFYPTSTMTQAPVGSSESSTIDYKTLFIRKMNKNVTDDKLIALASQHGTVVNCQIKKSAQGQSLGKALVSFASKDDANRASQKLYFADELGANVDIEFYQHDLKFQKIIQSEKNNEFVKAFKDFKVTEPLTQQVIPHGQ